MVSTLATFLSVGTPAPTDNEEALHHCRHLSTDDAVYKIRRVKACTFPRSGIHMFGASVSVRPVSYQTKVGD
jgi:hypothetical protein